MFPNFCPLYNYVSDRWMICIGFGLGQTEYKCKWCVCVCVLTYQYIDKEFNHIMDARLTQSLVSVLHTSIDHT